MNLGNTATITLFVAGKKAHVGGLCSRESGEEKGQPWCHTKKHLDYYENVGKRALELIDKYEDKKFFAFFHFRDPDHTGHEFGENSVAYSEKIIDDDQWLGKIIAKLKELGSYEQTMIYVTTDHGFNEGTKIHSNAPYGFLATNDPIVIRNGDRKDIAPTILNRYGLSREKQGRIPTVDGYILDSLSSISCVREGKAYIDYPDSPKCCSDLRLISLDKFNPNTGKCIPATGGESD